MTGMNITACWMIAGICACQISIRGSLILLAPATFSCRARPTTDRCTDRPRPRSDPSRPSANSPSIQQELQADCFAGLWAYSIRDQGVFQPGEIKEALDAASAVGDDHIQEITEGSVNPETWTHGSSAQRVAAFNAGFTTGETDACKKI